MTITITSSGEGATSDVYNFNFQASEGTAIVENKDDLANAIKNNDVIIVNADNVLVDENDNSKYTAPENKTIITDVTYLPSNVILTDGSQIDLGSITSIGEAKKLTFTDADGNVVDTITLDTNFKGEDVIIKQGSVEISGKNLSGNVKLSSDDAVITNLVEESGSEGTSTAGLTIQSADSTVRTLTLDDDVTVRSETDGTGLTVDANVDVVASSGVTVTLAGNIVVKAGASLSLQNIEGDGTITVERGGTLSYVSKTSGVKIINNGQTSVDDGRGLKDLINEDTVVSEYSYLTGKTTIAEGVTLTITRTGTLDLMGFELIVNGSIVVERGGSVDSSATASANAGIQLTATGSIENSGIIGNTNHVIIRNSTATEQYVEQFKVTGMSIELARVSGTADEYNMNVYGDVSRVSGATDAEITLSEVVISQNTTFGSNVVYNIDSGVTLATGVALTVNGNVVGNITIDNGSSVVVNGSYDGDIVVIAGTVGTGSKVNDGDRADATVTLNGNEKGLTVSASRVTYADENGDTVVEQRAYMTGNVSRIADPSKDNATVKVEPGVSVSGVVYVTDSLVFAKEISVENTSGYFNVASAGTVQFNGVNTEGDMYSAEKISYYGARYVTETAEGVQTVYYTSFDSAMASIASALDSTIYISGTYEVSGQYTIGDLQYVYLDDNAVGEGITIAETAQITTTEDGVLDKDVIDYIEGRLFVTGGYGCTPDKGTYAVMTSDDETGDKTYSGFKIALDNAQSGQTITVVGEAEYKGSMTIGDGITVEVEDKIVLKVTGNLTIAETAKLVLGVDSQLIAGTAGKESTITVYGTLDAEFGEVSAAIATTGENAQPKATVDLYSTGTTIANVDGTSFPTDATKNVDINAAYYSDAQIVYTSVNKAIDYAENNSGYPDKIVVMGDVTERDDITTDGIDIEILGKSVFGNITLTEAKIYIGADAVEGAYYSATVSGLTGEGDAAVMSTVSVTESTATIENTISVTATGADDCVTTINKVGTNAAKATSVTAGTIVFIGTGISTSDTNTLSVANGAELVVDNEDSSVTFNDVSKGLSNEGTITLKNTISITNGIIGGTLAIADEASVTVDKLIVTGNLSVSATEDKEASLKVITGGELQLGATPEMLGEVGSSNANLIGEVTLDGTATVIVYAGSSVADATILNNSEDAEYTAYVVNGVTVATAYGANSILSTSVPDVVYKMKDLDTGNGESDSEDDPVYTYTWKSGETDVESIDAIGKYSEVTAEIDYAGVYITISVGPRITLSIDGIVWGETMAGKSLSIGTHTVSAIVDPGFTGDVTITFNGQAVTNGQINVTSDMLNQKEVLLSVSGNITQDSTVVIDGGNGGSNDMGLTDYLLIVLVILIVIMAIIVALRLMRS